MDCKDILQAILQPVRRYPTLRGSQGSIQELIMMTQASYTNRACSWWHVSLSCLLHLLQSFHGTHAWLQRLQSSRLRQHGAVLLCQQQHSAAPSLFPMHAFK